MSDTPHVGSTILHYKVLRVIGSGGMGVVYEAEDTKLGRRAALKFLPPSLVRDRAALERFTREARAASALNHPNICTIYAIEQWNDEHFIAMELLDGESLDRRAGAAPSSWEGVIEIGAQVADALEAAHQRGIVHRDIKPANILVTRTGTAKILDFGVAKVARPPDGDAETVRLDSAAMLTGPGVAVGTIAYMSPEQARGEEVDARSDLFSLAAVLYEMATGRAAFRGKTSAVIFQQILGVSPESPRDLQPAMPAKLDEIIVKGLEKDRELRYQTAGELRADLKRLKRDTTASSAAVAAAAPASRAAKVLGFAVIASIGLAMVSAYVLYKAIARDGAPAPPAAAGAAMSIQRLTNSGDVRGCGSIAPDGKAVSYCDFAGRLYVRQVLTGATISLGNLVGATTFSPDGNYVYVSVTDAQHPDGALLRIPTFGGEPRTVLTNISGAIGVSPDGNRVAFLRVNPVQREVALVIVDVNGGNERRLLAMSLDSAWLDEPGVSWSPDGKLLSASQSSVAGGYQMRPVVVDATTGQLSMVSDQTWAEVGRTIWLPGNRLIFPARQRILAPAQYWVVPFPGGPARKVTSDARGFGNMSLGATSDGSTIATAPVDVVSNVFATNAEATAPLEEWTTGLRRDGSGSLSPIAGGRVYYSSADGTEISIWLADGPGQRKLVQREADSPTAPADGKFIVYQSLHEGRIRVFRVEADGTNARMLTRGEDDWAVRVAPDGRSIYYTSATGLMRLPADGGEPVAIGGPANEILDVSPDGHRLLVSVPSERSVPQLAILAADSGAILTRFDVPGVTPRWGRRSDLIAYLATVGGVTNLWEKPLSGGAPRQLTKFTSGSTFNFAYSPDRKRLFLARGTRTGDLYLIKNFQ